MTLFFLTKYILTITDDFKLMQIIYKLAILYINSYYNIFYYNYMFYICIMTYIEK